MHRCIQWFGLAALIVTVGAASAVAGTDGKYTGKVIVNSHGSDGSIGWTFTLSKDGSAKLEAVRGGRLRMNERNVETYGDVFRSLTSADKVSLIGNWDDEGGGDFRVRFNTTQVDNSSFKSTLSLDGEVEGDRMRIRNWNREIFGEDPGFNLTKRPSHTSTGDAMLAGAAVIALGAIISNNDHHPRPAQDYRYNRGGTRTSNRLSPVNVETGGFGKIEIQDSDYNVSKLRVRLDSNGSATITIWSEDGRDVLTGTWTQSSDRMARVTVQGELCGSSVSGSGDVNLRSSREVSSMSLGGSGRMDGRRVRWSASFSAARG